MEGKRKKDRARRGDGRGPKRSGGWELGTSPPPRSASYKSKRHTEPAGDI